MMKLSDLKKLIEKSQKLVELEKEIELIPYQWQYIKSYSYFAPILISTSLMALILKNYYTSLSLSIVALLFMAYYHASYRKWSHKNKKLIQDYAQLYKTNPPNHLELPQVKKVTPTKIENSSASEIAIQKNHLGLIKSDDLPS